MSNTVCDLAIRHAVCMNLLGLTLAACACATGPDDNQGPTEQPLVAAYELTEIDSEPLPAVLTPGFTDLVVAGSFETTRNGAWEMTLDYQDGGSSRWVGTYQWFGSSGVTFVFRVAS